MNRLWLLVLALMFIGGFAFIIYTFGRDQSTAPIKEASSDVQASGDCVTCGAGDDTNRAGRGRILGEVVEAPLSGPFVAVAYREECSFCVVPIAIAARTLSDVQETCTDGPNVSLIVIPANQTQVESAQSVTRVLADSDPETSIIVAEETLGDWLATLATSLAPAVLAVDSSNMVVGGWLGFDPGHGNDLSSAIEIAAGCSHTSSATSTSISSALTAVIAGDMVPAWILDETGIRAKLPATLVFTDATCTLCQLMEPKLVSEALPEISNALTTIVVDSTASLEHIQGRTRTLEELAESSPIGALIDPQSFESVSFIPAIDTMDIAVPVYTDDTRSLVSALVGGVVPSSITIDAFGRVRDRIVFSSVDDEDLYLQRVTMASAALAAESSRREP